MRLPAPNSRVAFIGPTRCGKTFLARSWLAFYQHVIIIDPKCQFDWKIREEKYKIKASTWRELHDKLKITGNKHKKEFGWPIIWQPKESTPEELDEVYRLAFTRTNTLVYNDELYFLTEGSSFGGRTPWYRKCVTAGASKGIGVWSAFQRPALIPLIALTETEVRAIFYLRTHSDRKRVTDSFGDIPWEELKPKNHDKYKYSISTDEWTSSPMRLSIKENLFNGSISHPHVPPGSDTS